MVWGGFRVGLVLGSFRVEGCVLSGGFGLGLGLVQVWFGFGLGLVCVVSWLFLWTIAAFKLPVSLKFSLGLNFLNGFGVGSGFGSLWFISTCKD